MKVKFGSEFRETCVGLPLGSRLVARHLTDKAISGLFHLDNGKIGEMKGQPHIVAIDVEPLAARVLSAVGLSRPDDTALGIETAQRYLADRHNIVSRRSKQVVPVNDIEYGGMQVADRLIAWPFGGNENSPAQPPVNRLAVEGKYPVVTPGTDRSQILYQAPQ